MIEIFDLLFAISLLIYLSRNEEGLILLSKLITIVNNIRDKSPRQAKERRKSIAVEYKFGRRTHCILIPIKEPLDWIHAAGRIDGNWVDKTIKLHYYAGPFKNFHSLPLRGIDISPKYEVWAFRFRDGSVIHVQPTEIIITKLKNERAKLLQAQEQSPSAKK